MGRTYTESDRVIEGFEAVPEESRMTEEEQEMTSSQILDEDVN